jgi:membrane-associated phospholipid phosphatase
VGSSPILTRPRIRTRAGTLAAVATLAGALAVFLVLSLGVRGGGSFSWDRAPVDFFDDHYYDLGTVRAATRAAVRASIALGLLSAAGLLALLVAVRAYRRAAFWGLAVGGSIVLTRVLKELIERPEIGVKQAEYSFPSGNATASLAAAVALFLLLPSSRLRRWVVVAGVGIIPLYGLALVLLLWHYPSDVIAGWALALAWVLVLRLALSNTGIRRLP